MSNIINIKRVACGISAACITSAFMCASLTYATTNTRQTTSVSTSCRVKIVAYIVIVNSYCSINSLGSRSVPFTIPRVSIGGPPINNLVIICNELKLNSKVNFVNRINSIYGNSHLCLYIGSSSASFKNVTIFSGAGLGEAKNSKILIICFP